LSQLLDLALSVLEPSLEGDLVVHAGQERIVRVALVDESLVDHDVVLLLVGIDPVEDVPLGGQLEDLVLAVHLGRTILALHAPVEQLVEVNEAIVSPDGHLEHVSLLVLDLDVLSEAKGRLPVARFSQSLEEVVELRLLDVLAVVSLLSQLGPNLNELRQVLLEVLQNRIVLVVLLKLLRNDQNEEVQHDMSVGKNQHEEVGNGKGTTTVDALDARIDRVIRCSGAVKHDLIPILASCSGKHEQESIVEVPKVLQLIDNLGLEHILEEEVAEDSEDEEEQHEEHEDREESSDGELNSGHDGQ